MESFKTHMSEHLPI